MARSTTRSADLRAAKEALADRILVAAPIVTAATTLVSRAIAAAGRGVHAVGIGRKIVAGRVTAQPCIRIYVVQKIAKSLLSPGTLLPESIDGITVDVIQSPRAYLLGGRTGRKTVRKRPRAAAAAASTTGPQGRSRPLVAGVSIAHRDVTAGTLGAFCRKKADHGAGAVYVLSNNHVLANLNRGLAQDDVYQPGPNDGGTAADAVANLEAFVPVDLGSSTANQVDCAIASVRSGIGVDPKIVSIGALGEPKTASATDQMAVRKYGRTTGLTNGVVDDTGYTGFVGIDPSDPNVIARFKDQLRVVPDASSAVVGRDGDSGSLFVTQSTPTRAVGLLFAAPQDGSYALANQIDVVTSVMGVELL